MSSRLDIYTLQLFVTVAETKNLTQAALVRNVAPSALSKRISDLEANLQTRLFHRLRRGVEPTPAGLALYHHAQQILGSVERAEIDLADYTRGIRGHVTLLANISSIIQFLPRDLRLFRERHPDIQIALREAATPAVIRGVSEGSADLGICIASMVPHKLSVHPYNADRMVLVVPPGHPLLDYDAVTMEEALDFDFVGLHSEQVWTNYLVAASHSARKPLRMRIRVPSFDAMVSMVEAGHGISMAPIATIDRDRQLGRIVTIDIEDAWTRRVLDICHRETEMLSSAAKLLLEHLCSRAFNA
ncbi:LysR family transcriptional regulator [Sphingobium terrigena]|uniref:LysR family transcriptional regulator n=1 Tax=Sphingobium terrigena TaxID=2304063 RepID=A0A418YXT3_9SPHN|nr:LysR substrate-binding domain-containing protein [Sphingobium terrigena]RJG57660.1 LysR family transcriptional regulator [Sphingobium terrigena]